MALTAAEKVAAEKAAEFAERAPVRNWLMEAGKASAYGGVFGGIYGFNKSDADLIDKLHSAREGMEGGMIAGPLIKTGLDAAGLGVRLAKAPFDKVKADRAEFANKVAEEAKAAGAREFPPAMNQGVSSHVAAAIDGGLAGRPLREGAKLSIQDLERGLEREIRAAGGDLTPAQVGELTQNFLRKQLLGEGEAPNLGRGAGRTPEELAELSGVQPANPPKATPVKPNVVETPPLDDYLAQVAARVPEAQPKYPTNIEGRYTAPTKDDVVLPKDMAKRLTDTETEVANAKRRLEAEEGVYNEAIKPLRDLMGANNIAEVRWSGSGSKYVVKRLDGSILDVSHDGVRFFKGHRTKEEEAAIREIIGEMNGSAYGQWQENLTRMKQELQLAERKHLVNRNEEAAYRDEMVPQLTEQRRQTVLKELNEAAEAEAKIATQKAREDAVEREKGNAAQVLAQRRDQLQKDENARALVETAERQQRLDAEHARKVNQPFELGNSPLSMKGQMNAAYEQVRQNVPTGLRGNPLGRRATEREPQVDTHTTDLIFDIAHQAQRNMKIRGFKEREGIFEPGDTAIQPNIMKYLREHIGEDFTKRLEAYAEARSSHHFVAKLDSLVQ